jgi:SAM-dependent methyltransferase
VSNPEPETETPNAVSAAESAESIEPLDARLARLERERIDADRLYNDALTALDRCLGEPTELPHPPPAYDAAGLGPLNAGWDLLAGGPPAIDRSWRGRLTGFVWRIVAPALERQRQFNTTLVEHLNRNVVVHDEARKALTSALALARHEVERTRRLHASLIQYLQTITLYVDTKDRASAGRADVLNAALGAITDDFLKRWESIGLRDARMADRVAHVLGAVDEARQTSAIAQQTALSLKRDLERMTTAVPAGGAAAGAPVTAVSTPDFNAFKYLAFENAFRGSTETIRGQLASYAPLFDGLSDVVDMGCGRGEFLDLLRAQGTSARGIDVNEAMVEETRARGLAAEKADALSYLTALPDASIGGLFAAQVIEHLAPDYLSQVIEVAARKIRPGGRLVLETINPTCWVAFFESYIRDLTHVRPIHPETLQYLLRVSGFQDVRLTFTAPVAPEARLQRIDPPAPDAGPDLRDMAETINDNVDRLNSRLFSYQDYAAIATR